MTAISGNLAQQVMTQAAAGAAPGGAASPAQPQQADFSKMMEEMGHAQQAMVDEMLHGQNVGGFDPAQHAISAQGLDIAPEQVNPAGAINSSSKVGDLLAEVNRGQLQLQSIMEMATSGRKFNTQELLAMQAGVFQIAQELELTSKVFEQVNTAHRTVWNTNIQG